MHPRRAKQATSLCLAFSAMRRAPQAGQNPRFLQEKATSFSWAHSAQAQKTMDQYAAFEKGIELFFDEIGVSLPRSQARLGPKRSQGVLVPAGRASSLRDAAGGKAHPLRAAAR